ncbi:MAG: helix-turn-helix domain-containing protein [Clostridia bacterium]|nr:helix-turn-helix domain-containing protein [Clostridia bacterium]
MDLIEKLHILMSQKNIKKISQLSRETNIPYTTLKSIFDGDVNDIRLSTSRKLCDYFEITLDDLLDDDIELTDFYTDNNININGLDEKDIEELNRFVEFLKTKKKQDKK